MIQASKKRLDNLKEDINDNLGFLDNGNKKQCL